MNVILSLLTVSLFTNIAHADTGALLQKGALSLVTAAQTDIVYLDENIDKCTSYASMVREKLLQPISTDLLEFQKRFSNYHARAPLGCAARKNMDFVIATIQQKLDIASNEQRDLMGMSGDQAMTKSLSWDRNHLDCKKEAANDPTSTKQLRTYFALKIKLTALKVAAIGLREQAECEKRPGAYFGN